jgi:hypothetical protein
MVGEVYRAFPRTVEVRVHTRAGNASAMQINLTITKRSVLRILKLLVAIALAIALIWLLKNAGGAELPEEIDAKGYQVVALDSGELYFGRLEPGSDDSLYVIKKAYIIRERPAEGKDQPPVREVVSIEEQLYAPERTIVIRRDSVATIQNLSKDSTVVQAIKGRTAESEGAQPQTSDPGTGGTVTPQGGTPQEGAGGNTAPNPTPQANG